MVRILLEGRCDFYSARSWTTVPTGAVLISQSDGVEALRTQEGGTTRFVNIGYRPEALTSWRDRLKTPLLQPIRLGRVTALLELLFEEAHCPDNMDLMVLYLQCLDTLIKRWLGEPNSSQPNLADLWQAIRRNPGDDWSLERMAEVLHVSRNTLIRRSKAQTGETPSRQLERIRVELAADWLRRREHTLAEVSRRVGYASYQGLSAAFRRQLGQSPRDYLRTQKPRALSPDRPDRDLPAPPDGAMHPCDVPECPFPAISAAGTEQFHFVNLRPFATRYRHRDPDPFFASEQGLWAVRLQGLFPGVQRMRGVPFEILDEEKGHTCVTVDSGHWRHADIPQSKHHRIPLGIPAERIYFLHCAAFVENELSLGRYELHFADGRMNPRTVNIQPLGNPDTRPPDWSARASIQNCWETFPQFDNAHSAFVPIPQYLHALTIYLYITEWINPFPSTPIREIGFHADSSAWGSVILMGITCQQPMSCKTRRDTTDG